MGGRRVAASRLGIQAGRGLCSVGEEQLTVVSCCFVDYEVIELVMLDQESDCFYRRNIRH